MTGKRRTDAWLLVTVIVLSMILGGVLWRGRPDLTAAERERERIKNEALAEKLALDVAQKARLSPWVVAGKATAIILALAGGALVLVAGIVAMMVAGAHGVRRALTIDPDETGLFPLIVARHNGQWQVRDPNRAIDGVTAPGHRPALSPGQAVAQLRVTTQAQVTQTAAAVHRHPPVIAAGGGRAALPAPGGDPVETEPAPVAWPARVPLTGLLNGSSASLARLVIGVTVDQAGQWHSVTGDMARMVHVAVGGSAGWGKSVFVQSLAYQLIMAQERPALAMIDLDGTTLSPFANCDRLLYPLADNQADALAVCSALADELERRKELFARVPGVVDLASYNRLADEPLAAIILLCDEATALLGDKSVEAAMRKLALRGRKFWLWLVLAAQDWKANSFDSAIKNQFGTIVQLRAMSPSQSRVLLQRGGAESLPVPGRALAILPGQDVQEIQVAQVSHSDIVAVLSGQKGPRNPLPQTDDVNQAERIRQLAAQGLSQREIEQEIFNYTGGTAYKEVKRILDNE